MTPKELSKQARDMNFEDLIREVNPLLSKYARKHVPGFESEDVKQELLEVLYTIQQSYDSSRGSFLNVLIKSFKNRLEWLRRRGTSQVRQIIRVSCSICDDEQSSHRWGPGYRCASCGSRKMDIERANTYSLDELKEDKGSSRRGQWQWEPLYFEIGYGLVEAADQYQALSPARRQEIVAEMWA